MTVEETIKAVSAAGFRFMLAEDSRCWSAMALGDPTDRPSTGALYTRAIGQGKTLPEALKNLVAALAEKTVAIDGDYSDLC